MLRYTAALCVVWFGHQVWPSIVSLPLSGCKDGRSHRDVTQNPFWSRMIGWILGLFVCFFTIQTNNNTEHLCKGLRLLGLLFQGQFLSFCDIIFDDPCWTNDKMQVCGSVNQWLFQKKWLNAVKEETGAYVWSVLICILYIWWAVALELRVIKAINKISRKTNWQFVASDCGNEASQFIIPFAWMVFSTFTRGI